MEKPVTDLGKLFLSLTPEERNEVTNLLIDVGLCIEFKTDFRLMLSQHKAKAKGKLLRLYLKIFAMSNEQLDRVAGLILKFN